MLDNLLAGMFYGVDREMSVRTRWYLSLSLKHVYIRKPSLVERLFFQFLFHQIYRSPDMNRCNFLWMAAMQRMRIKISGNKMAIADSGVRLISINKSSVGSRLLCIAFTSIIVFLVCCCISFCIDSTGNIIVPIPFTDVIRSYRSSWNCAYASSGVPQRT